jgi:hypothetical protein
MKRNIRLTVAVLAAGAVLAAQSYGATEPGAVDFGTFAPAKNAQFVEVNVPSNLITMALNAAKKAEPEVAEALAQVKQIRVNVIGLTEENRGDVQKRVQDIRSQLDGKGWEKLVTAIEKKDDVRVYIKMRNAEAVEGIVVSVLTGDKEAVLINVVGDIRPEKLAMLGDRFDIEPLKKVKIKTKADKAEKTRKED